MIKIYGGVSRTAAQMRPGDVHMEHALCCFQNSLEVTRVFQRHTGIKNATEWPFHRVHAPGTHTELQGENHEASGR